MLSIFTHTGWSPCLVVAMHGHCIRKFMSSSKTTPFYPEGTITLCFLDLVNVFSWGPPAILKGHPRRSPHRQSLNLHNLTPASNLRGWNIFKTSLLLSTAPMWPRRNIWILALINYGNVTCFIKTYSYLRIVHHVYSSQDCLGQRMKTDWKGSQGELS